MIASLQRELEALRAENAELRRRLGLDSSTSSKPPSSDGLRKKPLSLREPSGRANGGQKGHKGETLRQIAEPDRIVTHEASACRHCGCRLSLAVAAGVQKGASSSTTASSPTAGWTAPRSLPPMRSATLITCAN